MRIGLTFLTMAALLMLNLVLMASPGPTQNVDPAYKAVYDEWRKQWDGIQVSDCEMWVRPDCGLPEQRQATRNLLSIGPNLTPFIVDELRTETDHKRRYILMILLDRVSGVNLYYGSGVENFWDATPELIKRFIVKWDSDIYLKASELLKNEWKDPVDGAAPEKVDPKSIVPIIRYGVYALPFIFESLNQRNSSVLFAAYLRITGESDQYREYIESPATMFQTRNEKLSHMKAWARENETKFDKLGALHPQIKAIATQ
jgi:hypothetical protein